MKYVLRILVQYTKWPTVLIKFNKLKESQKEIFVKEIFVGVIREIRKSQNPLCIRV